MNGRIRPNGPVPELDESLCLPVEVGVPPGTEFVFMPGVFVLVDVALAIGEAATVGDA